MMKRKSNISILLLLIIVISSCSFNEINSLKFQSIKTTLLEVGSIQESYDIKEMEKLYKNSEITFSNYKYLLLKKSDKTTDSISLLSNRNKVHDILSNVELDTYPTDNFYKCYSSKGINCDISKKLLDIIGIKNVKNVKIQIGKSLNLENRYLIIYENKYVHLVSENEMAILTYK